MGDLQIKITVGTTEIELQGEGELVYKTFSEIREMGLGRLGEMKTKNIVPQDEGENINEKIQDNKMEELETVYEKKTTKKRNTTNKKITFQLLKDLDVINQEKSLKDFMEEKNPVSNIHKTTVFVYYLEKIMELPEITINHIYTCYSTLGLKIPGNLKQNIADVSSKRHGYIIVENSCFTISVHGINFVEHTIPQKKD